MSMIALGGKSFPLLLLLKNGPDISKGAIGTGLFVGSGSALATGGPVGFWLGYVFMGLMV